MGEYGTKTKSYQSNLKASYPDSIASFNWSQSPEGDLEYLEEDILRYGALWDIKAQNKLPACLSLRAVSTGYQGDVGFLEYSSLLYGL